MRIHEPVMVREVLELMRPRPGGVYVDGTLGTGGHARALWEAAEGKAIVVGIEVDPRTAAVAEEHLRDTGIRVVRGSYTDMPEILRSLGLDRADGVLLDLGLSSFLLEASGRGFSFRRSEPLDMRFDPEAGEPLHRLLNRWTEEEIAEILRRFGEEGRARRIARALVRARDKAPLFTTDDLNRVVASVVPARALVQVLPRVYQAFRIAVNREMDQVAQGLWAALRSLHPEGRLVVIAYHSLEDRIVKQVGRLSFVEPLTRKPRNPSPEEIARNPRSRSARLRAFTLLREVGPHEMEEFHRLVGRVVPSVPARRGQPMVAPGLA